MYDKKALVELGKSFLRGVWFTVLGFVATFLVSLTTDANLVASTWTVASYTLPVGAWLVLGIGFAVKAIDRYIYSSKSKSNGIAPTFLQK